MRNWLVAKVKPNKEASVMTMLAQWDVETFYPKITVQGRLGQRREGLFPTYVFCLVDRTSPLWPRIRWAPGLSYFLGSSEPASIPEDLITHLRERVREWNAAYDEKRFSQGERVDIVAGPFAGMDGIFNRYVPARERCQVLLNTVGGQMAVEMPESGVRPYEIRRTALA